MAHPGSEAAIDNYQEEDAEIDLSATTPHVTKPLTLDEAAAELSTFFEASDTEQAIDRKEYEDQKAQAEDLKNLKVYYLDLLNHREISSEIAAKFQVFHESPQFIVIRNGVVVHHSSHSVITPQVLHQFV